MIPDFSLLTGYQWPSQLYIVQLRGISIIIRCYWLRLKNWTYPKTHVTKMKSTIFRLPNCYEISDVPKLLKISGVCKRKYHKDSGLQAKVGDTGWWHNCTQLHNCLTFQVWFKVSKSFFFLPPPREYDKLKARFSNMEIDEIRKLTGCMKPCQYRE